MATNKLLIEMVARVMSAAGDPSRYRIIDALAEQGEMNVMALCKAGNNSQPATSHHLALMRSSGVVEGTRNGKERFYKLTDLGKIVVGAAHRIMEKLNGEISPARNDGGSKSKPAASKPAAKAPAKKKGKGKPIAAKPAKTNPAANKSRPKPKTKVNANVAAESAPATNSSQGNEGNGQVAAD
jgi:DNA-binding transcriptional ArsR family regulator